MFERDADKIGLARDRGVFTVNPGGFHIRGAVQDDIHPALFHLSIEMSLRP
jgi:hypothetical protein